ncbi:hypothetical protein SOVF_168350 [Spinacia oleracea]|uniref:Kunitz trypsin inhibitor 5-like n=1 Tax=Spinacia oleracea TaxID=3562 RepID=A0A9R0I506_SPIOL|nr:kunitz trypsin inhibitor 5-like [Spinacia oleracea]KNA07819.1 hypothetical protein SOVF_168350 [Spinacia oleracea]
MTNFILSAATFLFFLLSSPPSTTAAAKITPVFDINGRPLQTGSTYYILPVIRGRGGGLTMTPINTTQSCPLYVAQENHEVSNGLPLKIYPVNPNEKRVPLGGDVNIVFDAASICVQSTGWMLAFDEATGKQHVATGGTIGNPGVDTLSNWFRIEKAGSGMYDYKVSFCPGVCIFCTVMCGDVGVFIGEDGTRFLGLTDRPLLVKFKKA